MTASSLRYAWNKPNLTPAGTAKGGGGPTGHGPAAAATYRDSSRAERSPGGRGRQATAGPVDRSRIPLPILDLVHELNVESD